MCEKLYFWLWSFRTLKNLTKKRENLVKDHFYYCLRDRLEYAKQYSHECAIYIKNIEFRKKTEKYFYKNRKCLFLITKLINLPSDLFDKYCEAKGKFGLKRCLNEIEVISKELKKYE